MKELVEVMAKALVDKPEAVQVTEEVDGKHITVKLKVDPSDMGKVIGKQGRMLKRIGLEARRDIESLLDCHVNLQLWVKFKEDWRNRPSVLHELGYE